MIYQIVKEKLSRQNFVDRVRYYPQESYERAVQNYLESIPLEQIKSVYQTGSIKNPGISDIDLLVVFKDADRDSFEKYGIGRLTEKDQYLFSHNPIFLDERSFSKLNLWFSYFSLKNLYGPELSLEPKKREKEIALIIETQYLITKLPHDLLRWGFITNEFHERSVMTSMSSLRHDIVSAGDILGEIRPVWRMFSDDVDNLRATWFEKSEKEQREGLYHIYTQALKVSSDLAESFSEYIQEHALEEPIKAGALFKPFKKLTISFEKEWQDRHWLKCLSFYKNKKAEKLEFSLPVNLACFLLSWANSENVLARRLRSRITSLQKSALKAEFHQALQEHSRAVEDYFQFHTAKFKKAPSEYFVYWATAYRFRPAYLFHRLLDKVSLYINKK